MSSIWAAFVVPLLLLLPNPTSAATQRRSISIRHSQHLNLSLEERFDERFETDRVECGEHLKKNPDKVNCPGNCPYLRLEPTRFCQFKCVVAEDCNADNPLVNFADPATMRCSACFAPACHLCGGSSHTCAVCQQGFELSGGKCLNTNRFLWDGMYFVVLVIIVFVLVYLVQLIRRPVVNQPALTAGLDFRKECKVKDRRDPNDPKLWPLRTDLTKENIGGAGLLLFFHWQEMMLMWSFLVCGVFVVLAMIFDQRPSAVKHAPGDPKSFEACNADIRDQHDQVVFMEQVYYYVVWIVYVLSTVGSLFLAANHAKVARIQHATVVRLSRFMAVAEGIPKEVRSGSQKIEDELKDAMENSLKGKYVKDDESTADVKVVGVSICWDIQKSCDDVQAYARADLEHEEDLHGAGDRANAVDAQRQTLAETEVEQGCLSKIDPQMKCIDIALGYGGNTEADEEQAITGNNPQEVKDFLGKLKTTEQAFVVFNTERERDAAVFCTKESKLDISYGDQVYPIKFVTKQCEPDNLRWDGFGTGIFTLLFKFFLGVILLVVIVIILDICLYAPYVAYILANQDLKGMPGGSMIIGTILGLLITVANAIIYASAYAITCKCGFWSGELHQQVYVVFYTVAVLFNTLIDLATVVILAAGYSADNASMLNIPDDAAMSPKALADHPSLQRELYLQLMSYMFPGCLLLPFLLEPVFGSMMPYLLGKWLVRSRKDVTIAQAEDALACPQMDLSRYGDILINICLCTLLAAFTYRDLYKIFSFMTISVMVIYAYDHYRFLRVSADVRYVSNAMDKCAMYLTALPCAVLAMCLVFRIYGAKDDFLSSAFEGAEAFAGHKLLGRNDVIGIMFMMGGVHLLVHFFVLLVIQEIKGGTHVPAIEEYKDIAVKTACTFLNANPVHCLRSKYIYEHHPHCVMYMAGRDYLIKKNENIGMFFTGMKCKEEIKSEDEDDDLLEHSESFSGKAEHYKNLARRKAKAAVHWAKEY